MPGHRPPPNSPFFLSSLPFSLPPVRLLSPNLDGESSQLRCDGDAHLTPTDDSKSEQMHARMHGYPYLT